MPPEQSKKHWNPSAQQMHTQALLAFACLELLYEQGQMSKSKQELFVYEAHMGNPARDIKGQVDMVPYGEGM